MKILHLEDSEADAELVHHCLREEWADCHVDLVVSRDDFMRRLGGGHDLILSDFKLVGFDGLEALRIVREKFPDLPFIFLSGTIGEDRAVEAIRAGATDYVIKDRPKRLVPSIRRAIEDARHRRERRAAEEQLLRVQRLENIGMLAAGIAHDFNNVLAPVLMAIPLLRDRMSEPVEHEMLTNIERSVMRGAGLVRQIVGFAHGATGEPQLLQPRHLVRELISVLRQTLPKTIHVEEDVVADLWPLKVNPTHLHQILLNLCVNARDAMPQGGTLQIRASNRQIDEVGAAALPGMHAGAYLLFEVTDNGTGIAADLLERIWEPFFTTKQAGCGTGMGLATVRSLVENYRGTITCQTRAGRGTSFRVFLPAEIKGVAVELTASGQAVPRGQGELVLVVDDETSVRDVVAAILNRHGYRVLVAADGAEAIALFAPRSLEVRLVITDLAMPTLDGLALVRVMRNLNPAVRILAMSGLADQQERFHRQPSNCSLLVKPFTAEALLSTVHELLVSPESVAGGVRAS